MGRFNLSTADVSSYLESYIRSSIYYIINMSVGTAAVSLPRPLPSLLKCFCSIKRKCFSSIYNAGISPRLRAIKASGVESSKSFYSYKFTFAYIVSCLWNLCFSTFVSRRRGGCNLQYSLFSEKKSMAVYKLVQDLVVLSTRLPKLYCFTWKNWGFTIQEAFYIKAE